mmetsp:Transcript_48315/g.113070  ORF Transcript_48315/g.113070 Transcript_48315/m.113070 type:complete len:81 (+) Transcript_48315:1365-1607(+)
MYTIINTTTAVGNSAAFVQKPQRCSAITTLWQSDSTSTGRHCDKVRIQRQVWKCLLQLLALLASPATFYTFWPCLLEPCT